MKKKERKHFYSGKTTFMNEDASFEIEDFTMRIYAKCERLEIYCLLKILMVFIL